MSCVFPGFTAVFASSLRFVSILIKEDFPTLDLPIKAYSCRSEGGKGYRGARSKQYRVAKQSVMRALTSAYAGRKERKRQFRQLWIARINAAARINGLSYSKFMYGLKQAGVEMNRKILSDMAISDAEGFAKLAELAKSKLA